MRKLCCMVLTLLPLLPLQSLCLRDWVGQFEQGARLAYRSGNNVALLQLEQTQPLVWSQAQVDAVSFHSGRYEALPTSSNELWQRLLDLPLEPLPLKKGWRPKLALLQELKGPLEWQLMRVQLPADSPFRTLHLYVAQGRALEEAHLPSPWPYWIENHETLHKWVAYLISAEQGSSQPIHLPSPK